MYQAFISSHCQREIVCSCRVYPYGEFGKDSWRRPCLCWTSACPTPQCCHLSWGMHKWNPAGLWTVCMFHSNSEVPTFFSLAVELPQGRGKGETERVHDSQLHSVKILKVWGFSPQVLKVWGFPPQVLKICLWCPGHIPGWVIFPPALQPFFSFS